MGRTREELGPGLRSVLVQRYVLFYRVTTSGVEVLRILHGVRDLESLLDGENGFP
jgi:toxin ParE1/3/4